MRSSRGPSAGPRQAGGCRCDFRQRRSEGFQRAMGESERLVPGQRGELVRRRNKGIFVSEARSAQTLSANCGCVFRPVPTAVPRSQARKAPAHRANRIPRVAELRHVTGKFLAERERSSHPEGGPANLHNRVNASLLPSRLSLEFQLRNPPGSRPAQRQCAWPWKYIVGRLPILTSSFGWTSRFGPRSPPSSSEARLASTR